LEAEVHALGDDVLASTAPTFRAVLEDRSMLTLLNVMLPPPTLRHQLHYQSVKLQLNAGADGWGRHSTPGGCQIGYMDRQLLAVIHWMCFLPYALLGLSSLPGGVRLVTWTIVLDRVLTTAK
jgi:hypothetical protein